MDWISSGAFLRLAIDAFPATKGYMVTGSDSVGVCGENLLHRRLDRVCADQLRAATL